MRRLGWRRPVAVFVTALLCLQMMGFGTVSYADTGRSSDAAAQSTSAVATAGSSDESGASESSVVREGDAASNAAGGVSNMEGSSSDESDFSNGGGSLTDSPSGDGDLSGTSSGDADASDDNASAEGGSQNGGAANKGAAMGDGSEQDGTESAGAEGGSQQDQQENAADADDANGSAGEDAGAADETRDPLAWQGDLDACTIDGKLTVETSRLDAPAWDASELPDTLFATLRVNFEITPGDDQLVSGDTVEVDLPAFTAYAPEQADDGSTPDLDAFRLNEDGTETDEAIASAQVKDGVLKVTFSDAAATDDANATVRGYVDVPVSFASELLGDAETQQPWTVQKDGDDERIVMLALPSASAVLDAWKAAHNPLGMLSTALGISDGTVTAESASTLAEEAGTTVTTEAGPFDTQVYSQIIWCDNNYGNRPAPSSLEAGFIPQYSINGTDYFDLVGADGKVTEQAKTDLHLTDAQVAGIENGDLIQITRTAVNTYDVTTTALPGEIVTTTTTPRVDKDGNPVRDENGTPLYDVTTEGTRISWQLKDTNSYEYGSFSYLPGKNSTWGKQYKMLTTEVSFNVVGKVGDGDLKAIFQSHPEYFQFGATIDNNDQGSSSVAQAIEDGWLHIEETETGCRICGTVPQYDENGYPIVYYITYTGPKEGEDYYQASYDNSESANHGGAVDAVYTDGTLTLRHAGTTSFDGTKVWLDGGNRENRPEVTYTLWRYSTQGSPERASQVSVAAVLSESPDAPATNATGFVEVTAPAGSDTIDFHELLAEKYGDLIDSLPKYDPDGYPYIYCLREDAVAGYEQVFGTVSADGGVSDTAPRYENEAGTDFVDVDRDARPDADRFVYNGGTLSNRLTGTTTTQMTKTWEIAAFQDSLQGVVCTFQAQSRPLGSQDENAWKNVESANATQTLTSWNAETLSKTLSQGFPRYDAQGNALEYRWVETGVTLDGQDTNFTANDDGTASFTISVRTGDEDATEELQFTSTPVTVQNDDGSFSTSITNTFRNVTDQHVDKYWEQADGTLAQIAPDPAYSDGNATVQLYQDGAFIGEFTMDGATDADATAIANLQGATWQETSSYHIDFEGLPKYSPEGKRYTYLVLETAKEGWNTERTYDPETRTTRIDNTIPVGEGSEIRVTKKWIDGDDAEHRYPVRVELVANEYLHSQATNPDGSYAKEYQAGDVVATVDLTEDELWYAEVDVPIGGLTYKNFTAREVGLVASDNGTPDDMSDDELYPAVTIDEAEEQYPNEDWVNVGWTNPENRRVATPEHVYETRSAENDTLASCEVTNRRLGLFDLTVEKTWNDALGADEDGTRPGATLTLSCDEYPQAFFKDENGNLRVSVSGNSLPVEITDDEGDAVEATVVDANGDPVQDGQRGSVRIDVDTTRQSSTYHFEGMPKYDADGMNVHYSVNEAWTGDRGDYYSIKTVGDYVVVPNARHFQDNQTVTFDNNRSGTRDVVFYKEWHDNYVSQELNQRPDISLTLYRVSANQPTPEPVPGFINLSWSALTEGADASNNQKATISGLPKYDSAGAEYVYYASETMSADGVSLGYGDVQFDYDSIDAADAEMEAAAAAGAGAASKAALVATDAADAVKVGDAESGDPTQNGTGWAIREDGTFVNRLSGNLEAHGTKLWENIPGNVAQDDLPEVTVYLQQRLAGGEWPAMYADVDTREVEGTVASTSDLEKVTTNQYSYSITEDRNGDPLPRYDESGNRYEYRAVEIIWGLLDQPGGFTADDIEGIDLSAIRDEAGGTGLTGAVYVIQHGETGSFLLRNVYGGTEKGNLTVKKLFDGRDSTDTLYPDVTFNVYRYYLTGENNDTPSAPARVASHTLSQDDFGGAGNGLATYTFENLDVYAPDGSRWIYYVTESTITGYETVVGTSDLSLGDAGLAKGDMVDASGTTATDDSAVAMRSKDLGTFDNDGAITGSVIANDENVDVTFANTYKPGNTKLTGTKEWNDYNNIFSVRPDTIDLKFTRSAGGVTEEVGVQFTDSNGSNYFTWTEKDGTGDWTFELNNIEQWAPNGQAWEYHVKETLAPADESHYTIVTGESSATAGTSDSFRLENALSGKATVQKSWNDGDDPYGLRPESVTVELQARTAELDESGAQTGGWSDWQNAYEVWQKFASDEALASENFKKDDTQRVLNADQNGWRASWTRLPVLARWDAGSVLHSIEYRVVEVKIGDQDISDAVDNNTDGVTEGVYDENVVPYQPSQESWSGSATEGWATTISNTLEDLSISATKAWDNDADDAWGTRPEGSGGNWEATYFLQQRTAAHDDVAAGEWQWVIETGSGADASVETGSPLQDGVVSRTITGTGVTATATWDYLPKYDMEGNGLQYRVVEQVPGSYDVTDASATEVTTIDTAHRYYVVDSEGGAGGENAPASTQEFTNTLRTTSLMGTKLWNDHDTGIAPDFDAANAPQMTLWRQVQGGTAEQVKMKDGTAAAQPTWNDVDGDGVWTFVYEDLPAADENDRPYTYWAEEQAGSVDGWYPTYGTADAAGTSTEGGQQTGTTITNVATLVNLAKASDFDGDTVTLRNIELSVLSPDGQTTYAIWTNGGDGQSFSAKVWPKGTTDTSTGYVKTNGSIAGLKAGDYLVRETGTVPEGYAKAPDTTFHLNTDGTANTKDGVATTTENGVSTVTVTVEDPVLRGHLQLTKYVSEDGTTNAADAKSLEGATFDLYRVDMDGDDQDELIASGLATDADGKVTTVGNDATINKWSSKGEQDGADLTYGGKYTTLADGLPEGTYYFVETATTPGAVLPSGDAAKSPSLVIAQDDHYDYTGQAVGDSMANERFNATVILHKYDTADNAGIEGIKFTLSYKPEGSETATSRTVTTGAGGELKLENLEKGSYTLTEQTNAGYADSGFSAAFTIENADDDKTFDIENISDGADIGFTVTSGEGTFTDGTGIPNVRSEGQVTLRKQGAGETIDAAFDLQMKVGDEWKTVVTSLETSNAYELTFGEDGITATAEDVGNLDTGLLTVTGLTWNTYRFVETSTAPGYLPDNDKGDVMSSEFIIGRNTPNMTASVIVRNYQTDLVINKANPAGQDLNGAKFTVTPVGDSTFAGGSTDVKTIATEGTGRAELKGLLVVDGTYEIYEVAGPSGYDPVDAAFRIHVENDGYLTVVDDQGQKTDLPEGYERTDVDGAGTEAFSFIATNEPMVIELMKVSASDGTTPLAGATFRLTGQCMDGDSTHTYTTDGEGKLHVDAGLMGGVRYALVEDTVPAGYIQMETLYFMMDDRGEIVVTDAAGNSL